MQLPQLQGDHHRWGKMSGNVRFPPLASQLILYKKRSWSSGVSNNVAYQLWCRYAFLLVKAALGRQHLAGM